MDGWVGTRGNLFRGSKFTSKVVTSYIKKPYKFTSFDAIHPSVAMPCTVGQGVFQWVLPIKRGNNNWRIPGIRNELQSIHIRSNKSGILIEFLRHQAHALSARAFKSCWTRKTGFCYSPYQSHEEEWSTPMTGSFNNKPRLTLVQTEMPLK